MTENLDDLQVAVEALSQPRGFWSWRCITTYAVEQRIDQRRQPRFLPTRMRCKLLLASSFFACCFWNCLTGAEHSYKLVLMKLFVFFLHRFMFSVLRCRETRSVCTIILHLEQWIGHCGLYITARCEKRNSYKIVDVNADAELQHVSHCTSQDDHAHQPIAVARNCYHSYSIKYISFRIISARFWYLVINEQLYFDFSVKILTPLVVTICAVVYHWIHIFSYFKSSQSIGHFHTSLFWRWSALLYGPFHSYLSNLVYSEFSGWSMFLYPSMILALRYCMDIVSTKLRP